jgi:hypothetical protein
MWEDHRTYALVFSADVHMGTTGHTLTTIYRTLQIVHGRTVL